MFFDLLNKCLQTFYKISNLKISIWIILLIPITLGVVWYIYISFVDKKFKNDKMIENPNFVPNGNINHDTKERYIGKIFDTKSFCFKSDYFYFTNELLVTIAAGIFIILNNLGFDWIIKDWTHSKIQIVCTCVLLIIVSKIVIQGFIIFDIVNTIILISQILISILLTKRLPPFIFWYTYLIGLVLSFYMFRIYKTRKKNPFQKIDLSRYEILTPEQIREKERQKEEMRRASYNYYPNYSQNTKSEKESLLEMKHPGASSTQMSNMLKFGENSPNG